MRPSVGGLGGEISLLLEKILYGPHPLRHLRSIPWLSGEALDLAQDGTFATPGLVQTGEPLAEEVKVPEEVVLGLLLSLILGLLLVGRLVRSTLGEEASHYPP